MGAATQNAPFDNLRERSCLAALLLVATLVASLTKQFAVLLLRHALAALLDD